jgi:sterol desaturase/sphingolipid hydroxylase (fatty acid hydroxylase superfamily)
VDLARTSPLGFALVVAAFAVLFVIQMWRPLRKTVVPTTRHVITNVAIGAFAAVVSRFAVMPAALATTYWTSGHGVGIFNWIALPPWPEVIFSFVLLDFTFYYWHRLNHQLPTLWRFHNVHHIDLDLDVSTALRFHYGEIALSSLFRVLQLGILGIKPGIYLLFDTCFIIAAEFHHSNWRLPFRLEALLNKIFVTPRMHGIHHSVVKQETNSNYSTIFSWWDRLNGSFRPISNAQAVVIGVPAYRRASDQKLLRLFVLPFLRQRTYWNQ